MKEALLTGNFGIVILLDEKTVEQAYTIANKTLPPDAEYVLSRDNLPHITLFHTELKDLEPGRMKSVLEALNGKLKGARIGLDRIASFKDFYVFWHVSKRDHETNILRSAHNESLILSLYRNMSENAKRQSVLNLALNPQEVQNINTYGHPWVRGLYSPHITLGFSQGVSSLISRNLRERWKAIVANVVLAQIGFPGRIRRIIEP